MDQMMFLWSSSPEQEVTLPAEKGLNPLKEHADSSESHHNPHDFNTHSRVNEPWHHQATHTVQCLWEEGKCPTETNEQLPHNDCTLVKDTFRRLGYCNTKWPKENLVMHNY